MQPISRRNALLLGGLGVAGTVAGGAGLWWSLTARPGAGAGTVTGAELVQPPELRSAEGRLEARLEAGPVSLSLGGRQASARGYNGGVPGPTLRVRAGDAVRIRLLNSLAEPTNLHLHGLHVSPQANGDNVFVTVNPGESFDFEYQLPADHPPGVYWYHPHHHGVVAGQRAGERAGHCQDCFPGLYRPLRVPLPRPGSRGPGNDGRDRSPLTMTENTFPPGRQSPCRTEASK